MKLNADLAAGRDVFGYAISPDGSSVAFTANPTAADVSDLFVVPIMGGVDPTKLNEPLPGGHSIYEFFFTPDSSRIVYLGDVETDDTMEVFSVAVGGGESTKLNGPLVAGGNVTEVKISPDSRSLAYRADQAVDDLFELYVSSVVEGQARKVSGPMVAGGDVAGSDFTGKIKFSFSSNSDRIYYLADQDIDNEQGLYVNSVADSETTLSVTSLQATDSGFTVKFNAPIEVDDPRTLRRLPRCATRGAHRADSGISDRE